MKVKDVTDVDMAFGKIDGLMPNYHSIPDEFKHGDNEWIKWQMDWFFDGLKGKPTPKKGIDIDKAMRHLSAIQRSYEPKHEHKQAGVAYLASQWFEATNTGD